jgi:hypothetical protein
VADRRPTLVDQFPTTIDRLATTVDFLSTTVDRSPTTIDRFLTTLHIRPNQNGRDFFKPDRFGLHLPELLLSRHARVLLSGI